MQELQLVKAYRDNEMLRKSFNGLASEIFGIDFEVWYQNGFWTDKYEPISFIDNNKVVANASVNKIDLVIDGEPKRGLQIGTVMTHPDYRGQGLSRKLMEYILEEYEQDYDLLYLFANKTVLDFYPKFGFRAVDEYQFSVDFRGDGPISARKLDGNDLSFIYHFAADRLPVSKVFGTLNTQELLMFYAMYVFTEEFYYLAEEDVIAVCQHESGELHLFDIISKKEFDLVNILQKLANHATKKVVFHFTPESEGLAIEKEIFSGSEVLFVKTRGDLKLPEKFKHPITAQA